MNLRDVLAHSMRPCPARLEQAPYWSCDLPAGHEGQHASLHVHHFAA